jgi:hypothetical protein
MSHQAGTRPAVPANRRLRRLLSNRRVNLPLPVRLAGLVKADAGFELADAAGALTAGFVQGGFRRGNRPVELAGFGIGRG